MAADVPPERSGDTGRMLALSDGLFAIVLTLLVLDLKPEQIVPGQAYAALVELWPRLFAFFLTFLVGGSYWVSHHADLATLRGQDRTSLWLNLMFLLPVSLLPFTTALIGNNTGSVTWSLYAVNVIAIGLTQTALWNYVRIVGLIEPTRSRAELHVLMVRHLTAPAVFGVSIGIAAVAPTVAPYTALLIPFVLRVYARLAGWKEAPLRHSRVPPACGVRLASRRDHLCPVVDLAGVQRPIVGRHRRPMTHNNPADPDKGGIVDPAVRHADTRARAGRPVLA